MEKRECTKCKTLQLTENFYFDKTKLDFRSHCKDCVRAKRKEYREKNKKSVSKYNKVYGAEYRKQKREGNF